MPQKISLFIGLGGVFLIYFIVSQIEIVYKEKGWYGPNFFPPSGYISGPLSRDQGNNIWFYDKNTVIITTSITYIIG